jgi:hypothetical protein
MAAELAAVVADDASRLVWRIEGDPLRFPFFQDLDLALALAPLVILP